MTELAKSYAWCRQACRNSRSSFWASFALLDPVRRNAMYALYAFSRISDDLSDSPRPLHERRADLENWRQALLQLGNGASAEAGKLPEYALIWPALFDSVSRFEIPVSLLEDIVRGVTMDLEPEQPEDWSELKDYCYHVASAVGLACVHIWRETEEIPRQQAIDCGIAFQLTNILRDVAEDAQVNRIYLPKTLFAEFGICQEDWLAGNPSANWEPMIRDVATEAARLYASGWQTIHALTPRSQRMFSLIWRSYRSLLDDVVAQQDRLWHPRKVQLSKMRKAILLSTHFVSPLYASLREPCFDAP